MDRSELQSTAVFLLERSKRLICQWATGTGKSNVALGFIKRHPDVRCLILVPEQNNIDNWKHEFSKFGVSTQNVDIACYASYHKYINTNWGLIVFDEAPHLDTDLKREISQSVKGEYVLALGAKIDESEEQTLRDCYGDFYKTTITLEQAVKWGILPKPTVVICHMKLDEQNKIYWYKGKKMSARELYDMYESDVNALVDAYNDEAKRTPAIRERMFKAGILRKRFLGKMKQEAIRTICKRLDDKNRRYLCFCSSVNQANSLGGNRAFTSKTPKSQKVLEKFNSKEINSLFVVGKLIEGQNLVDIDCGVIGQIGGTERITIQSIGRIMRSESPVIYIPIFDGTKDESFLYTLNANMPKDYIKHYNFN